MLAVMDVMSNSSEAVLKAILELQAESKATTRAAIAQRAKVTPRTVSRITRNLQNARVIQKQQSGQQGNIYILCESQTGQSN